MDDARADWRMSQVVPPLDQRDPRACIRDPKVVAGGGFILFLLVLAPSARLTSPQRIPSSRT